MPTPNVYAKAGVSPFSDLPAAHQTNTIELLYMTDRTPVNEPGKRLNYSADRSDSMAFGACTVEIGKGISWAQLAQESATASRAIALPVEVTSTTELGRFPSTPIPMVHDASGAHVEPEAQARAEEQIRAFQAELSRRLAVSPRKHVLIFVHGFNNSFDDAALRLAELSHFLGREIVPVLYTWPSGASGGLLRGYQRDSESAEFTVYHFKEFMRAVADTPGVERIDILAHSRGNAVATTGMRELFLENGGFAAVDSFKKRFKIHNAVLAAADLDIEVLEQRMAAEKVGLAVDRTTVYICEADKALDLSEWLFNSLARLGQLGQDQYSKMKGRLANIQGLAVVDARVKTDFLGHGYFQSNPAVSSDLVLILRYDRDPGAEHGRPLKRIVDNYWEIEDTYPVFEPGTAPVTPPISTPSAATSAVK